VEEARAQLSERDYAQEYLGQFLETDSSVFTNVLGCVVDALPQTRQVGHKYLLDVDWGGPGRDRVRRPRYQCQAEGGNRGRIGS
jgi:hypothetical protein